MITYARLKEQGLTEGKDIILVANDGSLAMAFSFGRGRWTDFLGATHVSFTSKEFVFFHTGNDPVVLKILDLPEQQGNRILLYALRAAYDQGTATHYSTTLPGHWSAAFTKLVILGFLDILVKGPVSQ